MIKGWKYISRTAGQAALDWLNSKMPLMPGTPYEMTKWQDKLADLIDASVLIFYITLGEIEVYQIPVEDVDYFLNNLAGEYVEIDESEIVQEEVSI